MNLVHRSIFFSAIERYGSLFFFLFSTAILSRLLTPKEFGIYAVVNALTAVAMASFQEFGGVNYLIQKPSLSEQNIRTSFTIIFCLSALFSVAFFAFRDVLAWFFSQDPLRVGIAASAPNFLLLPFSLTISALLRREMAFATLARCNLVGAFVNSVISITLAALHFSFMAPILGALAGNAAVATLLIVHQKNLRIFRPRIAGYRDVFHFGAYSSGVAVINIFYNLSPQLILGRILDFTAVGLYSRAITVTQMFDKLVVQVLSPVIMPAISARARAGGDLKRIYLNSVELLAVVQWPFLIFVAMMAEPIIRVWLGPTWMEIVPLIRLLSVASLFLFAACLTYPILVAVGRIQDTLFSSLISLPPSLFVIFIASFFGVQAVAASALLTLPLQAIVAIYFVSRRLALSPADLLSATKRSGIVTACSITGVVVSIAIADLSLAGPIQGLLLASASAASGWWLGLVITNHPLLVQIRSVISGMPPLRRSFSILAKEAKESLSIRTKSRFI